jgi:hypothetical protein
VSGEKSSKSGDLRTGKIIPRQLSQRRRNEWNGVGPVMVFKVKAKSGGLVMYIGLGGLLILILILWLLGVI